MSHVFQKSAAAYDPRGRLDPTGFARHVAFETCAPPADLEPFVEHLWVIRWEGIPETYPSEEVMHRPYVDAFVAPDSAGIQGTFLGKRTYEASGSGRVVGVRFRPGAFHAFASRGAIVDLREKTVDLERVFPLADAAWVEDVRARADRDAWDALVALLRSKTPKRDPYIRMISAIIERIETDETLVTVALVAAAFGKSERWVQQLFRDYLGVGLKWLLQRHRLLAAVARIRGTEKPDWVSIAHELGYSSQQHFNTELKKVLGRTPTQYKRWTKGDR